MAARAQRRLSFSDEELANLRLDNCILVQVLPGGEYLIWLPDQRLSDGTWIVQRHIMFTSRQGWRQYGSRLY